MFAKNRPLGLKLKKNLYGFIFIAPFLIGFLLFFLSPLINSIIFSFNRLRVTPEGLSFEWIGFENYRFALMVDPEFRQLLVASVLDMVTNVPIIIMFSFFAATLLNQNFRGRFLARAIFFLPVILASGIIARIEQTDAILAMMRNPADDAANLGLMAFNIEEILISSRLDRRFVMYIIMAIDRIYQVVNQSGVQILVFLAGLQSIPASLFEAAKVEGATAWEGFWKITFPMVSPLILVNAIYSIIDSFTREDNEVMQFLHYQAFARAQFGSASAMSWLYLLIVAVLLGIIGLIASRSVFYHE